MRGIAAAPGIAIGRVYVKLSALQIEKRYVLDTEAELQRLKTAIETAKIQLKELISATEERLGAKEAEIFNAHLILLDDPELIDSIQLKLFKNKVNAEWAVKETERELVKLFEEIADEYIRERIADINDVSARLLQNLTGTAAFDPKSLGEKVIITAKDIVPSEMAMLTKEHVLGILTEVGGATSHTAIVARVAGIPAIVGIKGLLEGIKDGALIILDGSTGEVFVEPDEGLIELYGERQRHEEQKLEELKQYIGKATVTLDGFTVELGCNIGAPKDLAAVLENDGEGIGLFRSEFLYMDRCSMPGEEEQLDAYRTVVEGMKNRTVIIRTLDIGGDKQLPYLDIPKEENPFLGLRAIRYCLKDKEIFKVQLRAILRASAFGRVRIMLPMISGIGELREARSIIEAAKLELDSQGLAYDKDIKLGIMIETPAAAIISDILAKEADFFSIGTNDLTQYTLAVDRMNESIAHLYNTYHPAVLRLIKLTIDNAHKHGKWVGMCGEAAQDERLIPILLAMGLDELSVSPPKVLSIRRLIAGLSKKQVERQMDKFLELADAEEVLSFIESI